MMFWIIILLQRFQKVAMDSFHNVFYFPTSFRKVEELICQMVVHHFMIYEFLEL